MAALMILTTHEQVFMAKSQSKILLYRPRDSEVNIARQRFAISLIEHLSVL